MRTLDDVLALHTMRFADELVDPRDYELAPAQEAGRARRSRWRRALVEGVSASSTRASTRTNTARRCSTVVEAQGRGQEHRAAEPTEEPEYADDLLAALEASLAGT